MTALTIVHVLGAMVFLGTGTGIAFFMVMAHRSRDPALIAHTASVVVVADVLFTATAVVVQPVTGLVLARTEGYPLLTGWVAASLALYALVVLCWLPVVAIQVRLRDLARATVRDRGALPPAYAALFRVWLGLGVVALVASLGLVALMVAKPGL